MVRRCLVLSLVLAALVRYAAARDMEVSVRCEPEKTVLGQAVDLLVDVRADSDIQLRGDFQTPEGGAFEVLGVEGPERVQAEPGKLRRYRVRLMPFETGRLQTPEFAISWRTPQGEGGEASVPPAALEVGSYIEELQQREGEEAAMLRDIKPPIRIALPRWVPWAIAGGAGALALLVAAAILIARRMGGGASQEVEAEEILLSPDEEALRALAEVEMQDLARRESAKVYYTRLSEILRRYLGRRYGCNALDMTSGELLQRAAAFGWPEDLLRTLGDDMAEADSAKFARYSPSLSMRRSALERVRSIVQATRPAPAIEAAGEEPDGGGRDDDV